MSYKMETVIKDEIIQFFVMRWNWRYCIKQNNTEGKGNLMNNLIDLCSESKKDNIEHCQTLVFKIQN